MRLERALVRANLAGTSAGSKRSITQANSLRYICTLLNSLPSTEVQKVSLVIYTKPGCPYCQQARDYYSSKGMAFIDRDAQTNREYRAEMFKYSGDDPTVPCIVEDGKYLQSGWGDPLRG